MPAGPPDRATWIGFLTIIVLIGLNFIFVRLSNQELPPFWGATLRYVAATVLIFGLVAVRNIPLPARKALGASVLYGALNHGVFFGAMYWALVEVPASAAAVVLAALPLATYLMAAAVHLERITVAGLIGAVTVIVGIALVTSGGLERDIPLIRFLAVVLAVLAAAAAGVVVKRAPKVHPIAMNAVGMAAGAALLTFFTFAAGERRLLPAETIVRIAVLYLILSTLLLFVLVVWLIQRWTASGVAYATVLSPFVTATVAHFVLDEPIGIRLLLGGALVLFGVYWGALRKEHPKRHIAGQGLPTGPR